MISKRRVVSWVWNPAGLTLLITMLLLAATLASLDWDPTALARQGTRYSLGLAKSVNDPSLTEGYDGQFSYYIARNPDPTQIVSHLDVPAYRYQRILYPILVWVLSFGNDQAVSWLLPVVGIIFHVLGTWALVILFSTWGVNRWFALVYGCWAGFLLAIVVDLPEPMAYGLVVCGLLAIEKDFKVGGWVLLSLAVFSKEVTILFVFALIIQYLLERKWFDAALFSIVTVLPFLLFQAWLWMSFGQPGFGSGGAMATSFEIIPFMGIMRIGTFSLLYLLSMLVVFGPTIIWPTIWGGWKAVRFVMTGKRNVLILALLLNCIMVAFLPFSTFRETGGLLRLACGLVVSMLLFLGRYRNHKALNYSLVWLVLNVFLIKS